MFTVYYTEANVDNSGSVELEQADMTDVVTTLEKAFGIKLTAATMIALLNGVSIQHENLDLWIREEL